MFERDTIFQLTPEGLRCRDGACRLPQHYRSVLQSIGGLTAFEAIAAQLASHGEAQIAVYLEDLEAIGLVESVPLEWLRELHLLGSFTEPQYLLF